MLCRFPGTEDQTDRGLLSGRAVVLVQPSQVKLHLSFVGRLKFFEFQIDCNEAAQFAVIEEQVNVIILGINRDAFLPGYEGKISTEFKDEPL